MHNIPDSPFLLLYNMTSTFVALAIQYMFTMLIRCKYCTYTSLYIDDEWGRGYLFRAWRMCLLCLSETDRQTAKEEKANPLKSCRLLGKKKSATATQCLATAPMYLQLSSEYHISKPPLLLLP